MNKRMIIGTIGMIFDVAGIFNWLQNDYPKLLAQEIPTIDPSRAFREVMFFWVVIGLVSVAIFAWGYANRKTRRMV